MTQKLQILISDRLTIQYPGVLVCNILFYPETNPMIDQQPEKIALNMLNIRSRTIIGLYT